MLKETTSRASKNFDILELLRTLARMKKFLLISIFFGIDIDYLLK